MLMPQCDIIILRLEVTNSGYPTAFPKQAGKQSESGRVGVLGTSTTRKMPENSVEKESGGWWKKKHLKKRELFKMWMCLPGERRAVRKDWETWWKGEEAATWESRLSLSGSQLRVAKQRQKPDVRPYSAGGACRFPSPPHSCQPVAFQSKPLWTDARSFNLYSDE